MHGPDKVARGMLGSLRPIVADVKVRLVEVNGHPAIIAYLAGRPYGVLCFEVDEEKIRRIYAVVNPDTLRWLERADIS